MPDVMVSVITPTFNHALYIGRAIESLLRQTYSNWEQVIVDDGSTDDTASVVHSFSDPRITYIRQENRGVRELARTMNTGLGASRGELVTMLGSDDTWPEYRLEKQVPVFEDPSVVLCFGRGRRIDENDQIITDVRGPARPRDLENRPVGSVLRHLLVKNFIFQPSELIRRSALEEIGGYLQPAGVLAEDYPTHLALASVGEFRYLDLPLGNYRMHRSQMTRVNAVEMVESDIRFVLDYFATLAPSVQASTGWTHQTLERALSNRRAEGHFQAGRWELRGRQFASARGHFEEAFKSGVWPTKAKAICGIVCSLARLDMGPLIRLAGLRTLGRR